MAWDITLHTAVEEWYLSLPKTDQNGVAACLDALEAGGPGLGRPIVDTITGSRHANMKELRSGTLRLLFAFDPQREAFVCVGGDKKNDWTGWYERNIPLADRRFDEHLATLKAKKK